MKDPLGVFLLGVGFVSVLLPEWSTIAGPVMFAAGLVGLHRVLGSRAPLFLVAGVVLVWGLEHLWDVLPVDAYKIEHEHEVLFDAPVVLAGVVRTALFIAIAILARRRIGNAVVVLAIASLGVGTIANALRAITSNAAHAAKLLFGAIAVGWLGVGVRLTAIAFLASAFETKTARLDKRGLVVVGVIGASLFAATYDGLPARFEGGADVESFYLLCGASMALAWVLSAIGFAGLARAGGGAGAWVAMVLSILQLPMFVYGLFLCEKTKSMQGSIGAAMFFGLLAIGIAGVTAPSLGARTARGAAGLCALSAVFGTLVTFMLLVGGSLDLVHARDPFGPIQRFAIPLVGHAAVAWAACLAYLVAPPSARVAA